MRGKMHLFTGLCAMWAALIPNPSDWYGWPWVNATVMTWAAYWLLKAVIANVSRS